MAKLYVYEDDCYPKALLTRLRRTARGICYDDDGWIALNIVRRDDAFGKAEYYELPGGGLKAGEKEEDAIRREIREEVGRLGQPVKEIAEVWDAYNLIHQENRTTYYLFRLREECRKSVSSRGDLLIAKTIFVTLEEAISLYEGQEDTPIGNLVRRRELTVLKDAMALGFPACGQIL